jgi:hypothetical protein
MSTTTTTAIDLTHPTQIVTDQRPYGLGHRAECGCGWASAWTDDPAEAEAAGVDHREIEAGPGDSLDVVMSELLDLQDGLADMVVWLAENWSADLPVPTVYGCHGGPDRAPPGPHRGVGLLPRPGRPDPHQPPGGCPAGR